MVLSFVQTPTDDISRPRNLYLPILLCKYHTCRIITHSKILTIQKSRILWTFTKHFIFCRHYEFDSVRTPTDDIGLHHHQEGNQPLLLLPQKWNRPYLGYNPRRDRELGEAASCANRERVFSDSEIYSPVFPRGRPEPRVDITARVLAMKKEFAEYKLQLKEQHDSSQSLPVSPSGESASKMPGIVVQDLESGGASDAKLSPVSRLESGITAPSPGGRGSLSKDAAERLESLI